MALITSVLATFALVSVVAPSSAFAIVNGDPVNDDVSYPFVGLLRQPTEECTATLISPTWALTAGHCLKNTQTGELVPASDIELRFAFNRRDQDFRPLGGEARRGVETQYAESGLGLVRLDSPITDITPVQVALPVEQADLVKAGYELTIVGWGNIRANASKSEDGIGSREMRSGQTHIDSADVKNPWAWHEIKTSASATAPAWSSFGDSGGPLLSYKNGPIQVGIADIVYSPPVYGHYASYYYPTGHPGVSDWINYYCQCHS